MKRSKLSQEKQLKLIEHFAAGTTARTASVLVKVNKTTASYYFFGGKRKGKRGRGACI